MKGMKQMSLTRCPEGHLFSPRRYGNICPYCNKTVRLTKDKVNQDDPDDNYNDSMPYLGDLEVMEPVTGWLVCIEGPAKGRDYKILSEKNFVGRSEDMDIRILGDNHIAKKNHAVLVYDPKKRKTLILPGESQKLVYLNDETVYVPMELTAYDVIELGKSKFLFVPLCGEHFEWEEIDEVINNKKNADSEEKKKSEEKIEETEN